MAGREAPRDFLTTGQEGTVGTAGEGLGHCLERGSGIQHLDRCQQQARPRATSRWRGVCAKAAGVARRALGYRPIEAPLCQDRPCHPAPAAKGHDTPVWPSELHALDDPGQESPGRAARQPRDWARACDPACQAAALCQLISERPRSRLSHRALVLGMRVQPVPLCPAPPVTSASAEDRRRPDGPQASPPPAVGPRVDRAARGTRPRPAVGTRGLPPNENIAPGLGTKLIVQAHRAQNVLGPKRPCPSLSSLFSLSRAGQG